ncbi:ABC-three component system middle component 1 [Bdellovibrio sp. HCB-110]|uniref:ABC-three component system middle component 1 n=1 Tax=Bdellovibrio sp. HCB-110 TaxID=3391182 RepID=UPI0039B61550
MKMNDLFFRIMTDLDFKKYETQQSFRELAYNVSFFVKEKRAYFYLALGPDDVDLFDLFLSEFQGDLFTAVSAKFDFFSKDLSKNSYFILAISHDLKKLRSNKSVINLEEDTFFFKKMVIGFNEAEVSLLHQRIGERDVVVALRELASDQDLFENYVRKVKDNDAGFERLLYQILTKVPSIPVTVVERDFESLNLRLERRISDQNLADENSRVVAFINEMNGKPIDLQSFKRFLGVE